MRTLSTIFWLATKELRSLLQDWVLLGLVVYSFSLAIIAQAQGNTQELHNASIGIVDEDHSRAHFCRLISSRRRRSRSTTSTI